jgi:hypothetical protein
VTSSRVIPAGKRHNTISVIMIFLFKERAELCPHG